MPTCTPHSLCTTWVTCGRWGSGPCRPQRPTPLRNIDPATARRMSRTKTSTVVPAISFRRSAQPGAAPSRGLSSGRAAWPNGVAADRRGCFSRPRRSRYRRPRHLRLDDGGPKARASVILWGNGERTLATAVGGPAHVVRGANLKQPIAIPRGRNIPCWCFPDPGNEESQREAGFLNLVVVQLLNSYRQPALVSQINHQNSRNTPKNTPGPTCYPA